LDSRPAHALSCSQLTDFHRLGQALHRLRRAHPPISLPVNQEGRSVPGLSVHAVDVTRGVPCRGMRVEVFALAPEQRLIAEGVSPAAARSSMP